jgi:hypothetical protein
MDSSIALMTPHYLLPLVAIIHVATLKAIQVVELSLYLYDHALIHCDWKYDQTVRCASSTMDSAVLGDSIIGLRLLYGARFPTETYTQG